MSGNSPTVNSIFRDLQIFLKSQDASLILAPSLDLKDPPMLRSSLGLLPMSVLVLLVLYDQDLAINLRL